MKPNCQSVAQSVLLAVHNKLINKHLTLCVSKTFAQWAKISDSQV